jgi:hypothetical protein
MSATLILAREALAAALNAAVDGLDIRGRGPVRTPKQGDGWVSVSRVEPDDYTRCAATLTALIVLGADEALAEQLLDVWTVPLLDAATKADFPAGDVSAQPITLPVDGGGAVFALTLTLTTEVES